MSAIAARIAATPMLTDTARYVLALLIAVCVAALCISIAIWAVGRRETDPQAASRGRIGIVIASVAIAIVLFLALLYVL